MDEFGGSGSGNELYIITAPVDALTHKVTADLRQFKEESDFWKESSSDPNHVKRCLDAVEIIRHALDSNDQQRSKNQKEFRDGMASALKDLNNERF